MKTLRNSSLYLFVLLITPAFLFAQTQTSTWKTSRIGYVNDEGLPVYLTRLDGKTPYTQDFEDFIALAKAYRSTSEDPEYNQLADTNDDGEIGFADFVRFAQAYGRTAVHAD